MTQIRNRLRLRQLMAQNTNEFCQSTTLHGLKYVASKDLYPSERCFFGLSVILVLLGAAYFIFAIYDKWERTPVIVGLNPNAALVMREAFPALTICNSNLAVRTKAIQLPVSSAKHNMLQHLCNRGLNSNTTHNKTNWNNFEHFIINISQPCEHMILSCQFGSININCVEAFYPVLTDEGVCCVFNMLHPDYMYAARNVPFWLRDAPMEADGRKAVDWNAESGYAKRLPAKFFPRRTLGPGVSLGVNFVLNVESHEYYCGSSNNIGFKVLVHAPNESPSMRESGLLVEPGKETKVRIRPEKSESARRIRHMHPKYRRCLFHNEVQLRYYAHYTQRNCERECEAEQQIQFCGCRSYHMPIVSENTPICSHENEECVRSVRFRTHPSIKFCIDTCLPSCFDVDFTSEVFTVRLDEKAFADLNSELTGFNQSYLSNNIAVLNTYFKDYSIRSQLKTEFIGTSDFLANVGGLIGLFIGFSFISVAELIYFAILRPGRAIIQYHIKGTTSAADHAIHSTIVLKPLRIQRTPLSNRRNFQRIFPQNDKKLFHQSRTMRNINKLPPDQRVTALALWQSLQDDQIKLTDKIRFQASSDVHQSTSGAW